MRAQLVHTSQIFLIKIYDYARLESVQYQYVSPNNGWLVHACIALLNNKTNRIKNNTDALLNSDAAKLNFLLIVSPSEVPNQENLYQFNV